MADFGYARFGDDDDNEEEDDDSDFKTRFNQRDGLIFLIDATKSMFEEASGDDDDDEKECLFQRCIKAVKTTLQSKIISSERDLVGTVFFGTEKAENTSDFKHIYVYQTLDQPGAERILKLEHLEQNVAPFEFGHSQTYSLRDALWTCQNMFANSSMNLGFKRIILFTNNDDPHGANPQLNRLAMTKANDLRETGIDLELIHLQNEGQIFDLTKFYRDILYSDDDEINQMPDPAERMEELLERVRAKEYKKRANRRIFFNIGEGISFSVGVYNLVRSCSKPSAVKLTKKDNAELKSNTKTYLPDTGEVLMPQDMKKAQTYGGRKICFENDEVTEMKYFDNAGFYLMGFKPRSRLKKYYHVKPAQFIYPDEMKVNGSTTMFSALLQKCLERDVTPICKYIPGRNTPPTFVTLLPQAEEVDSHKVQVSPPGFHVIFLPTADDFRKVNYEETPRANTEQIDKAKEVIKRLKFRFSSENFENPVLQKHWRNIEALALERKEVEEITDCTLPVVEQLIKRAGREMREFKDMVFPPDYVPGGKKRPASSSASQAAKKVKTEDALAGVDIKKEAESGKLNKFTVAVLKECIKKEKIKTTATKKNDLIDAINNHYGL